MTGMEKGKRLQVGMVGGGAGAGIARIHRAAMRLEGGYQLVAGAFSRDPEVSRQAGNALEIPEDRTYENYEKMAQAEATRPDGIDVVVIVTPNDSHFPIASAFVKAGINVICEKPLTTNINDARRLHRLVSDRKVVFGITHNYSGYAMVRHAAALVREGALGEIRIVQAEYAHGSAAIALERSGNKQMQWRTDPAVTGKASVVFDIGTHAHHLARFITGLEITEVAAELNTVVPGRAVYDNAHVNLRFSNGARGSLWASMAATGNEHGLRIRVFGDRAALEWHHEDPEHLHFRPIQDAAQVLAKGRPGLSKAADAATRLKIGHVEGVLESFANIYTDIAAAIRANRSGEAYHPQAIGFPTIEDGVYGVKFVEAVTASHEADGKWVSAKVAFE